MTKRTILIFGALLLQCAVVTKALAIWSSGGGAAGGGGGGIATPVSLANGGTGSTAGAAAPFTLATTGTVTIDWNNGPVQYLAATGTVTLATPLNPVVGQVY